MFDKKYTARDLKDFLNEKFGVKKTGAKFTDQDVEAYIRRGFIPKYLGGYRLKEMVTGIRSVRQYKISEATFEFKRRKRK